MRCALDTVCRPQQVLTGVYDKLCESMAAVMVCVCLGQGVALLEVCLAGEGVSLCALKP